MEPAAVIIGDWSYAGSGHLSAGDAFLAQMTARDRYLNRRSSWEER